MFGSKLSQKRTGYLAITRRWPDADLLLGHRLRRWHNNTASLGQHRVLAGQMRSNAFLYFNLIIYWLFIMYIVWFPAFSLSIIILVVCNFHVQTIISHQDQIASVSGRHGATTGGEPYINYEDNKWTISYLLGFRSWPGTFDPLISKSTQHKSLSCIVFSIILIYNT